MHKFKWWHHPINVRRCAHYQTTVTENFILIAWKLQILDPKTYGGSIWPPPLGRLRVKCLKILLGMFQEKGEKKTMQIAHFSRIKKDIGLIN